MNVDFDAVLGVFVSFLVLAAPIAGFITKAVDFVRNLIDPSGTKPKVLWQVLAFVFGVAICLGWGFNPFSGLVRSIPALAENSNFDGIAGQILSGLAAGAMASFWHEKLDQWHSAALANKASAGAVIRTR